MPICGIIIISANCGAGSKNSRLNVPSNEGQKGENMTRKRFCLKLMIISTLVCTFFGIIQFQVVRAEETIIQSEETVKKQNEKGAPLSAFLCVILFIQFLKFVSFYLSGYRARKCI